MRNLIFSLTIFLIATACKQQRSYQQDVLSYFELNGTEQQYKKAVNQMFDLLKMQYGTQNVPENVWKELQEIQPEALTNIKKSLVPAYRSNFSHEDIKQLILFYNSDTGQQMVKDQNGLDEEQKAIVLNFFNSEIGKKVQNKREVLGTMVAEVSESWSKDLYHQMIEKLKSKGFNLSQ